MDASHSTDRFRYALYRPALIVLNQRHLCRFRVRSMRGLFPGTPSLLAESSNREQHTEFVTTRWPTGIWSAIPSSAGEEPSQVTHSGTGQRRLFSPTPCEPLTQSSQPCGALCTTSIEPMTKYQQAITGTEVPYLPTGPHVPVQSMLTSMPIQDPMRKTRARRPR
jgi:hypothetical protein